MSSNIADRAIYNPIGTLPASAVTSDAYWTILPPRESAYTLASRLAWLLDEFNCSVTENQEEGLQVPTEEEQSIGKDLIRRFNELADIDMNPYAVVDLHGRLQMTLKSHLYSVYVTMRSKERLDVQVFFLGQLRDAHESVLTATASRA